MTTADDLILWQGYKESLLEGIEDYRLKLPDVSFDTAMRFHGSARTAEAITFGGGHSVCDALLLLPEDRIAYLGRLLFIGVQPYLADGDPDEYLRVLDKIEALDAKRLVPGHGPVGTPKVLQTMRDHVQAAQKASRRGSDLRSRSAPSPAEADSPEIRRDEVAGLLAGERGIPVSEGSETRIAPYRRRMSPMAAVPRGGPVA